VVNGVGGCGEKKPPVKKGQADGGGACEFLQKIERND
jgi:hypothetical protein